MDSFLKLQLVFLICLAPALHAETIPPISADPSGTLRVMSFNIRNSNARDGANHWSQRKDLFTSTIRAFNPDLLGLQEVCADQYDYLVASFPDYSPAGVARDDGMRKGEWSLVLFRKVRFEKADSSTFWLSEQPGEIGSSSWDAACVRICSWAKLRDRVTGRELLYANTHFDHKSQPARLNSAQLLRRQLPKIAAGAAVILTGDFNCDENNEAYKTLVGPASPGESNTIELRDSYRETHAVRAEEEATFHGFTGKKAGARIDWILHTKEFRPISAEIVRTKESTRYPSDHFAVTAVFEANEEHQLITPRPGAAD